MKTLSKQQLRTRETQARLLDAAEQIFVRDGYEAAQLDEIAARAQRSKGSVYTHFDSKEDLFLALFEQRTRSHIARLLASLQPCTSRREAREVFRDFFVALADDRVWPILMLEFKLFALRRPESREPYRKAFEMSKAAHDYTAYQQMFGPLNRTDKKDTDLAQVALAPIISALILESHFEPALLSRPGLRRLLARIFDALFPASR
jgi:AcrR family transcriptional regulator